MQTMSQPISTTSLPTPTSLLSLNPLTTPHSLLLISPPTMDSSEAPPPKLPHPPYTKMIVAAIGALNEKTGSSKTAIAKFIDSSYSSLAQNRSVLLARNLKRLKTKEIICMVKHSYKLSTTTAADDTGGGVKRGRGRPRKSAVGVSVGGVKRGRGRPPKVAKPKPKPVGSGLVKRGRGRPPLKPKPIIVAAAPPSAVVPAIVVKRGRPPKVKTNPNPGEVVPPIVVPVGRPRGRPAKAGGGGVPKPKIGSSTGRPRGRPKKGAAAAADGSASTPTHVPIEE